MTKEDSEPPLNLKGFSMEFDATYKSTANRNLMVINHQRYRIGTNRHSRRGE